MIIGKKAKDDAKLARIAARLAAALLVLAWLIAACCVDASASGLLLYETGAPDLGTASAGRAGMSADASTAASNPAGMTLLDRTQLLGAGGAMLPTANLQRGYETNVPGSGGGGGNAGVFMPIGGFFFVYKLTDRLRFGIWSGSNFGLARITEHSG